jgi:hypothetical protein
VLGCDVKVFAWVRGHVPQAPRLRARRCIGLRGRLRRPALKRVGRGRGVLAGRRKPSVFDLGKAV